MSEDLTTILVTFENAAQEHARATEIGDYKTANRCYNQIEKTVKLLKANYGLDSLLDFLSNSSVGVRLWAAYYLLPLYEGKSVSVLSAIAKDQGIHSLTAETTISEWKNGDLKF